MYIYTVLYRKKILMRLRVGLMRGVLCVVLCTRLMRRLMRNFRRVLCNADNVVMQVLCGVLCAT